MQHTPYKRAERVSVQIQHEIANIIRDIKGLNFTIVTITKVKLTDDLQTARIFYSVFGSDEEKKDIENTLTLNLKHIRFELAHRLNLRRTPSITFEFDDTLENASKVFDLLEKIGNEKQ
jgi:ribosome-binding factor A